MISRQYPAAVFLAVAPIVVLTGCAGGGGGGGGSTVVTPPSPPAPPPPAPPPPSPPPTPQAIAFQGPYSDIQPKAGAFTVSPAASASSKAVITVTDPDVAAPTSFEQINFSGNETIRVQYSANGLAYDVTFPASGFQGKSDVAFGSKTDPVSTWSVNNNQFLLYSLQVGTPSTGPGSSRTFSKYAALTEWIYPSSPKTYGFEIIGSQTSNASMPNTGTAHYSGEAFEANIYSATGPRPTEPVGKLGTVSLDVDFAKRAGAVSGEIDFTDATLKFYADLSGASFTSRPGRSSVKYPVSNTVGYGIAPVTISGSFFGGAGAGAAEAAGIFSADGLLTGGFVASATGGVPAGPVAPAPALPPAAVIASYESPFAAFGSSFNSSSPNPAIGSGSVCQTGDASCGSTDYAGITHAAVVTIDDPDGSTGSNPINFNGDELVSGFHLGVDSYRPTPRTSTTETLTRASPNTAFARTIQLTTWQYTEDNGTAVRNFSHYLTTIALQVGARPNAGSLATGQAANYAGLIRADNCDPASSTCGGQFQLIGQQTAAADMPHTGSAAFDGEAYGYVVPATGGSAAVATAGRDFLAAAHLNVDFTKTTGAITGTINDALYQAGGSTAAPAFSISFSANISGGRFEGAATGSGFTTQTGANDPYSGKVAGAFYGPSSNPAKEAAGVFALKSATTNGGVVGGFVTRRP